jgi:hypothetical protein
MFASGTQHSPVSAFAMQSQCNCRTKATGITEPSKVQRALLRRICFLEGSRPIAAHKADVARKSPGIRTSDFIEQSRGANMVRPMTSNVAALSGIVANGHQALHFVSSAPSKIPYGGFSPVRLQTRLPQWPPSRGCSCPLIGRHPQDVRLRRFVRIQTVPRLPTPTTSPVALGSPSGCSVRLAHRLL